jgi:hypothetical protein
VAIDRLSLDAIKRVSGPAWLTLKPLFLDISDVLLKVSTDSRGVLTTIYVKYQTTSDPSSPVFAVAWLKSSTQIVLGLALPDAVESPMLGPAPKGMSYRGITKYLTLKPGDDAPPELCLWAKQAFLNVVAAAKE